jgi:hypothetical protein
MTMMENIYKHTEEVIVPVFGVNVLGPIFILALDLVDGILAAVGIVVVHTLSRVSSSGLDVCNCHVL